GAAGHLSMKLPVGLSKELLMGVPKAFHTGVLEVLLGALAIAVGLWRGAKGEVNGPVLVDVEGHGREPMGEGIDLSRTVGWFTSVYPVSLEAGAIEPAQAQSGCEAIGGALKRVKEQLRVIPGRGLG